MKLTENSAVGSLAGNVLMSALGCAAEALVTQSVPSQSTVLLSSTGALLSTGYDRFKVNSKVSELNDEFKAVEDAVISHFDESLRSRPSLRQHPLAKELIVAEEILGTWSFDFPLPNGAGTRREKYVFASDGKLTEIWPKGDGVESATAIYETDGGRVIVRWDSGGVETAAIEQIDRDRLSYQIIGHTGRRGRSG